MSDYFEKSSLETFRGLPIHCFSSLRAAFSSTEHTTLSFYT